MFPIAFLLFVTIGAYEGRGIHHNTISSSSRRDDEEANQQNSEPNPKATLENNLSPMAVKNDKNDSFDEVQHKEPEVKNDNENEKQNNVEGNENKENGSTVDGENINNNNNGSAGGEETKEENSTTKQDNNENNNEKSPAENNQSSNDKNPTDSGHSKEDNSADEEENKKTDSATEEENNKENNEVSTAKVEENNETNKEDSTAKENNNEQNDDRSTSGEDINENNNRAAGEDGKEQRSENNEEITKTKNIKESLNSVSEAIKENTKAVQENTDLVKDVDENMASNFDQESSSQNKLNEEDNANDNTNETPNGDSKKNNNQGSEQNLFKMEKNIIIKPDSSPSSQGLSDHTHQSQESQINSVVNTLEKQAMPIEIKSSNIKKEDKFNLPETYTLKGIRSIMSPCLLEALASCGVGDEVAIVDSTFSAIEEKGGASNPKVIRMDGLPIVPIVIEIMKLWELDEEDPVTVLVDNNLKPTATVSVLVQHVVAAEEQTGDNMDTKVAKLLTKSQFKERSSKAKYIVYTGEPGPWNSILLRKGIISYKGCDNAAQNNVAQKNDQNEIDKLTNQMQERRQLSNNGM